MVHVLPFVASALAAMPQITLDHIVYVVPSLADAMDDIESRTGIRPAIGGKHTTLGTHNALLALGDGRYLELFAPDPEATEPLANLIGVDGKKPRISTYCCDAGAVGIDELVARLTKTDYASLLPTVVEEGSRKNTDGSLISWRLAIDKHSVESSKLPMGGLLPFYIDWGECRNVRPAMTAPTGCNLQKLEAYHPEADKVSSILNEIGIEEILQVKEGLEPRLVATLQTPKGLVEIS